jgi:hypothetical protein
VVIAKPANEGKLFEKAEFIFSCACRLEKDQRNQLLFEVLGVLNSTAQSPATDCMERKRRLLVEIAKWLDHLPAQSYSLLKGANRIRPDAAVYQSLCTLSLSSGDYKACIADAREAVALNPDDAQALFFLGNGLARTGDLKGACAALDKACRIGPVNRNMLLDQAAVHSLLKDDRGVQTAIARLNRLFPGRKRGEMDVYGRVLRFSNKNQIAANIQSIISLSQSMLARDIANIEKACLKENAGPRRSVLLLRKSELELAGGRFVESLNDANAVLASGVDNYRVHAIKAGALYAMRKFEAAAAERRVTLTRFNDEVLSCK